FLIRSDRSADEVRDGLARTLPSTERAIILPCQPRPASCHGVSLEEHDRIGRLLTGAQERRYR
ncbi:MAG: hypothetical protein V2I43_02220, partial [Parvularcula sp.]|nr:hypothetical protein [Parvularcula sp.]